MLVLSFHKVGLSLNLFETLFYTSTSACYLELLLTTEFSQQMEKRERKRKKKEICKYRTTMSVLILQDS